MLWPAAFLIGLVVGGLLGPANAMITAGLLCLLWAAYSAIVTHRQERA